MYAPTVEEINKVSNDAQVDVDIIKDALMTKNVRGLNVMMAESISLSTFLISSMMKQVLPVYETIPIGIILTEEMIITVSLKDSPISKNLGKIRVKEFFTFKKTRFALQILFIISSYYLRYLKQINKKTNEIERGVHQSLKNKELYAFLALEKSLVYFTTSLKSNKVVLDKILRFNYLKMYEEDKDLLEDVIIEKTQAIEMAETYRSILTGMMNAFASIISNNLNIVMKFLTSITIILSFPTMVASFYGMNVDIPFQHASHSYALPLIISAFLTSLTAFIFWKKKYF